MHMMTRTAAVFWVAAALSACDGVQEISSASGSTVDVGKGRRFSVALDTSPTVSPEYASSWGEAQVSGGAVTFESRGADPKAGKAPGSNGGIVYFFKAVDAGKADIVILRKAGPKAEAGSDFSLHVRVK
jgi:hypothetical protein